ncbi:MAG: hypothetical protein CMH48_11385 [Muricauda sp.]|nr:hypothetical protein [Allomuricauda sp.]MBC31434.1 hypothetical protein [Allomuricauda sp.]|tara:strand:+ start:253 stop:765 length:513 start_codon:yes stop_codon:yes gene_type:complete
MKLSNKNKYLIGGVIAMLLLSYRLALHKTLTAREVYAANMDRKESISNLPLKLSMLGQRERELDNQLAALDIGSSSLQNNLLKFLNKEASRNNVKIIDFNSPHVVEGEKGTTETLIFHLEGSYTDILKTLNALENKGSYGTISHLAFGKKRDYRGKRTYLRAKIFLQAIK